MQITRDSLLVRWAYLWEDWSDAVRFRHTTVCALFWRCVLYSPLKVLFTLLVLAAVVLAAYLLVVEVLWAWVEFMFWPWLLVKWPFLLIGAGIGLLSVAIFGALAALSKRIKVGKSIKGRTSLAAEYLKAKKQRFCPRVEIV